MHKGAIERERESECGGGGSICMTKFCISNATSQKTCIDTCISYEQHINKIPAAAASGGKHTNIMIISFGFSVSAVYTLPRGVAKAGIAGR